jgi:hypothetical protein
MSEEAAKAARWLGSVPFEKIVDVEPIYSELLSGRAAGQEIFSASDEGVRRAVAPAKK